MRSILAAVVAFFVSLTASALDFPPSPRQLVAVNPITNKVYLANESAGTVTVLDAAHNTTKTITVGARPQFIVVNPISNRIYVNNGGEATLSVIDGATDTNLTPTPLTTGTQGPMAINTETNIVYEVRMTGLGTDEVTYFDATSKQWYTIATQSFQPTALTINPVTNTLYVAHYGTGDVRVISGAYDNNAHPTTLSIPAWSHPFAIAANSMTNKVYVITEDSRGPIGVIDGATNTPTWLAPLSGHAVGPKALAVDPVNNKAYALFGGELIVINPDNSLTYIPVATGTGVASIGINYVTNKIYVANDSGGMTIIDGDTSTTTSVTIPAGSSWVGINPITNKAYVFDGANASIVNGSVTDAGHGNPLTTNITPLPNNTSGPSGSISLSASNMFSNPLPVKAVYYQIDSKDGAWSLAGTQGGPFAATYGNLSAGSHTLYAFAVDGHVSIFDTGPQSIPLVGSMASYTFTVSASATTSTTSLMSSANPSNVGQSVTFTASVTGSGPTPTGSVTFKDGTTAICTAVALVSGSATCTTTALTAGGHTISATYSGDSTYSTSSASLAQTVNGSAAEITTPAPGATLTGSTQTFTWTNAGATAYQLMVGTSPGTYDIGLAPNPPSTATSATISGIPTDGRTIYVRLWTNLSGRWQARDYSYKAAGTGTVATAAELSSPAQGATLAGSTQTFTWTNTGASAYQVWVGTTPGAYDIGYAPNPATTATSATISGIPTDGRTIYVRLWSNLSGSWQARDYTFKAAGTGTVATAAEISSPAPGATLAGSTQTFTWTNTGASAYQVWVGTSPGTHDIGYGPNPATTATSATIGGIPTDGRTIYVRLWSNVSSSWQARDYTYKAAGTAAVATAAELSSPAPGSMLSGSTQTFTWTDTGAGAYQVWVGTSRGAYDIGYAPNPASTATSATISAIPTDGRTIYVRLWSNVSGSWQARDYTYTAAGGTPTAAAIVSPAPGSTLSGSTQTFTWSSTGANAYQVWVGTAPGTYDIGYAPNPATTATSATLAGIPTDGRTIYVRLWSNLSGSWQARDYTYRSGP